MNRFKVFIGYDISMPDVAEILACSLLKNSTIELEINYLKLQDLNLNRNDNTGNTEFTYTRFLVPYLCNYTGLALFLDNDMMCINGDLRQIIELNMSEYAIRCRKHEQTIKSRTKMNGKPQEAYPRKNWSSFMLMDCAKLKCWTKEAIETQSPAWLHRFEPISNELIGDIPNGWNDLDHMTEDTKLIHYTSGGPWNNGRKFDDEHAGNLWFKAYYEYKTNTKINY